MSVKAVRAGYAGIVDMMYVTCREDADLSLCHAVEDTPSGITIMYDADGSVIGVEISDFSCRYSIPARIEVDAQNPFTLDIDRSALANQRDEMPV